MTWLFNTIMDTSGEVASSSINWLSEGLTEIFSPSMSTIMTWFPVTWSAYDIMQVIALCIMILLMVFGILSNFALPLTEAEHPIHILIRSLVAMFCICFALQIMEILLDVFTSPYYFLRNDPIQISSGGADLGFAEGDNLSNMFTMYWNIVKANTNFFSVIVLLMIAWNYFKLCLEAVERYLLLGILTFTSPLAFSLLATKRTTDIFKAWSRMLISQCLLLIFNLWFLKGFDSAILQATLTSSDIIIGGEALKQGSSMAWQFALLGFLKLGQRIDTYLNTLGLNAAHQGGLLAMELGSGVMAAGNAMRGLGSSFSGKRGGKPVPGQNGAAGGANPNMPVTNKGGVVMPTSMSRSGKMVMEGNSLSKNAATAGKEVGGTIKANVPDTTLANAGVAKAAAGRGNNAVALSPKDTSMLVKSGVQGIGGQAATNTAQGYLPGIMSKEALGPDKELSGVTVSDGKVSGNILEQQPDGTISQSSFSARLLGPGEDVPDGASIVEAADGTKLAMHADGENALDAIHGQQRIVDSFNEGDKEAFTSEKGFPQNGKITNEGNGILSHRYTDSNGDAKETKLFASSVFNEVQNPNDIVRAKNGMKYYAVSGKYEITNDNPNIPSDRKAMISYKNAPTPPDGRNKSRSQRSNHERG